MHKIRHIRTLIAASIAALLLAACSEGAGTGGFGGFGGFTGPKAPRTTRLAGMAISVQGPEGFCVDRTTKTSNANGGFVVLGSCGGISNNPRDTMPPVRAALTASVSQITNVALATPDQLARFFASDNGQATLAHSRSARHVEVLETKTVNGNLMMHVRDTSPGRPAALEDTYWRGFFTVNGHLVSLTVAALRTHPFSDTTGQRLLRDFLAQMQAANPARANTGGGFLSVLGDAFGQAAS